MKIKTTNKYLTSLKQLTDDLGSLVFVNLSEDFVSEEHYPGARPVTLKRSVSECILYTVELAFALCNTEGLTDDPYVEIATTLGDDEDRLKNVPPRTHFASSPEEYFEYVGENPFYIINKRRHCFHASFELDSVNTPVVLIKPVSRVPHRSLVIQFMDDKPYEEWRLRQPENTWSDPSQLINQILYGLRSRNRVNALTRKDVMETSPGVHISWDFESLDLAPYYLSPEQILKAETISRKDYIKAFESIHTSVVRHLAELSNSSKNKAIVDYARVLILKDVDHLRDQFG